MKTLHQLTKANALGWSKGFLLAFLHLRDLKLQTCSELDVLRPLFLPGGVGWNKLMAMVGEGRKEEERKKPIKETFQVDDQTVEVTVALSSLRRYCKIFIPESSSSK